MFGNFSKKKLMEGRGWYDLHNVWCINFSITFMVLMFIALARCSLYIFASAKKNQDMGLSEVIVHCEQYQGIAM